ncbi:CKS-domain-containing protein [Atractiella rhizophila]|nr:CKS-domain-containing protein [Atractiella rhizophila]
MPKKELMTAEELEAQKQRDIIKYSDAIFYSARYSDDQYEYRHVIIPKQLLQYLPKTGLLEEEQWRGIGIKQSPGWHHYLRHDPEPWVLLFKRDL